VVAAVRADEFLDFAERLAFGPKSSVSVVRDDGLVLIRRPLTEEVVRLRLNDYALFTEHLPRAGQGVYPAVSPADGERRTVHYRRLDDLPLILVTGLADREVLADWWRRADQTGALMLLGMVALGGLALFGSRHAAREERALRELAASREHERLLVAEVDHRAKNLLAVIQALVRQTARTSADKEALEEALSGRLRALAGAHELLSAEKWTAVDLRTLLEREVGPFAEAGRIRLDGGHVRVPAKAAVSLGMVVHELATNAAKHGALSTPDGRVEVLWRLDGGDGGESPTLRLSWTEAGGPPVRPPQRKGFGTTLLERSLAHELDGSLELDFRPEGLRAEMTVPLGCGHG
jgi:two-component sensor histidine kinase